MRGATRKWRVKVMNLDLLQIIFGLLAFSSFVMAARTGLSSDETKTVKRILTHDTEFIQR